MKSVSVIVNTQNIDISRSDVVDAFERTEKSLDSDRYEHRYSPWHYLEIDGVKKPINDVYWNIQGVRDAAESKNDIHDVRGVSEQLGFELYNRREHAEKIFQDTLQEILDKYPKRQGTASKDKRLYQLLKSKGPNFLKHMARKQFDDDNLEFKGTAGLGNWPNIPWMAVLQHKETDTTQRGVYVTYLIDPERQVAYATLNQGTTDIVDEYGKREARRFLEQKAETVRQLINLEGFRSENPELSDNSRLYEESTIYSKKYELGNLPSTGQIEEDFLNLIYGYQEYLDKKQEIDNPNLKGEGAAVKEQYSSNRGLDGFSKRYFWVTAKPSLWDVSDTEPGDSKFYPAHSPDGKNRKYLRNFEAASKGDRVVFYQPTPVKKVVAEGVVVQGLHQEKTQGYETAVEGLTLRYSREVEGDVSWSRLKESPELEDSKPIVNTSRGSMFRLEEEEFRTILALDNSATNHIPDLELHQDLRVDLPKNMLREKALYFPESESSIVSRIESALNSGNHIIFTGPPGTGKTKIAEAVASELEDRGQNVTGHEISTATADWSTFETVGGYMPETGDSGELEFRPGQILRRFSGQDGSQKNECLVIDEINRADIDKAFGQFFTVLSGQKVTLPFETGEDEEIQIVPGAELEEHEDLDRNDESVYVVPESWRLLATMNTYDKTSLYELSYAFMRRFAFIRVGVPELEHDRDKEKRQFMVEYLGEDVWDVDLPEDAVMRLYDIWMSTNQGGRDIGPAIVKDMAEFLEQKDDLESSDYVQAVSSFVLPQLEGVQNKGEVVSSISGSLEDGGDLEDIARDMFDRIDLGEDG